MQLLVLQSRIRKTIKNRMNERKNGKIKIQQLSSLTLLPSCLTFQIYHLQLHCFTVISLKVFTLTFSSPSKNIMEIAPNSVGTQQGFGKLPCNASRDWI